MMTITEKILRAKQDYDNVLEAGKRLENAAFWETYQNGGNRTVYMSAFNYMSDETYNPKYPITIKGHSSNGNSMFGNATITDVKVPIIYDDALTGVTSSLFANARQLETIPLVHINENLSFTAWFSSCNSLKNLAFEGVIGQNGLDLRWSTKLSKESIKSIVNALSDTASGKTLTLSKTAVESAFSVEEIVLHPYTINHEDLATYGYTLTDNGDGSVTVNGGLEDDLRAAYFKFFEGQLPAGVYEISYLHEGEGFQFGLHVQVNDGAEIVFPLSSGLTERITIKDGDTLLLAMDLQSTYINRKMKPTLKRLTWESLAASKPNWTINLI